MHTSGQRGQALILIAVAFVGLAAFIGLAVDAGILFTDIGHLRRAVDAASLAAAGQFREGWDLVTLTASARQVLALNEMNVASAGVKVETCDTNPGDLELCYTPQRKMVRVRADLPVTFAFLPIIGFNSVTIHANAVSEAASLDIVLAIDTSDSQSYDAACGDAADDGGQDDDAWAEINLGPGFADGVADDGCGGTTPIQQGSFRDDYMRDPDVCNPHDQCRPFRDVQDAAIQLVGRLLPPYDRMAIVNFDRNAGVPVNLGSATAIDKGLLGAAIMSLQVYKFTGCPGETVTGPQGCTSTNVADGLKAAGNQFGAPNTREEAVWIVILLTDGGANAATDEVGAWICPGSLGAANWVQPFCRDPFAGTRHVLTDIFEYDPDDAARDRGDWVGCLDVNAATHPDTCADLAPGYGQGAVIFTIGLGNLVTENTACDDIYGGSCEPDLGEKLLRYIAAVGDDGNPLTDPCTVAPAAGVGESCGNYYYAPLGSDLLEVFEAIASRIFTRITH
jgi:hypothetical protein